MMAPLTHWHSHGRVCSQVNTVFLSQGEVMALTNDGGFTVPVAALGIADAAVIMVSSAARRDPCPATAGC